MTDLQSWVAPTYDGLADLLASAPAEAWDAPSLCEKWQVRHVVAHVTMPVRLTPEQFGAEMAAAGGDFAVLSDTVAARDGSLPVADHLGPAALAACCTRGSRRAAARPARSATPSSTPSTSPSRSTGRRSRRSEAVVAVLDQLTAANGALFGVDLTGVRLEAADTDWSWGSGDDRARRQRLPRGAPERPHPARRPGAAPRLSGQSRSPPRRATNMSLGPFRARGP